MVCPSDQMFNLPGLLIIFAMLLSPAAFNAATNIYKCSIKGSVTYQSDPCPTGEPRRQPTVEQLNADRQKRLRQADDVPANPAGPTRGGSGQPIQNATTEAPGRSAQARGTAASAPTQPAAMLFRCDGRRYCSQMTSCTEAKYFLTHCPGVKMDGDGDGIPCESQWCN